MWKAFMTVVLVVTLAMAGTVAHAGALGKLLNVPLTEDEELWFGGSSKYSLVSLANDTTIKYKAWLESSGIGVNASISSSIRNGGRFVVKITPDPTHAATNGTRRDIVEFFGSVACLVTGDVTKGTHTVLWSRSRTFEAGKPIPIAVGLFGLDSYNGDGSIPSDKDLPGLLAKAASWWVVYCTIL